MINSKDKEFNKVYNKLIKFIDIKTRNLVALRGIGVNVDYKTIKLLNLYIKYLNYIKYSKYEYFNIKGLHDISNSLNKL